MYKLYLGFSVEICMSNDEGRIKIICEESQEFNNEWGATKFAEENDDNINGYPYYACFLNGKMVFVS